MMDLPSDYDVKQDGLLLKLPRGADGLPRAGNVVIRERLGKGGMGAVYLGFDDKLDVEVAVKVLPFEAAENPEAIERFVREARTTVRVDHPNLVRMFTVDEEAGTHYLVMEFVDGESADARLKREGPLPERDALEIAIAAGEALSAAHAKDVLHRDVKPANILVRFEDGRVKLSDLGLAKALGAEAGDTAGLTATGQMLGTPAYMSPEQAEDASRADERTDIYSLGAALYALLSGKAPFEETQLFKLLKKVTGEEPEDLCKLRPELTEKTAEAVKKLMRKDPADRPQTMKEAVAMLRERLDSSPTEGAKGLARPEMSGRRRVDIHVEAQARTPASAAEKTLEDVTPEELPGERLKDVLKQKRKGQRKKRRRLSDEEKERFKRKGLLLKAIQFKRVTDVAIIVCLLAVVGGAFLPLIQRGQLKVAGWQVVLGHESQSGRHGLFPDGTVYARVTRDALTGELKIARGSRGAVAVYGNLPWYAYAFVGVYPLAALFILLYLLDFVVSLGRPLPIASALYGVLALGYMLFMVMWGGPFNEFKSYGLLSLLLGTFALTFVSLLRLPNSSRKRRAMLRAAAKGEPLEPFFAPAEKKEEAPPAEVKAEEEEKAEARRESEEEAEPATAPEREEEPREAGKPDEQATSEAAEAPGPGEGEETPSAEAEAEEAPEGEGEGD